MMKVLFVAGNTVFLALNLIDIEFIKFTGRRTSFGITRMASDVFAQSGQLIIYYWPLTLSIIALGILLWKSYGSESKTGLNHNPIWIRIMVWIFALASSFMFVRNSFGVKPMLVGHAFSQSNQNLGHLVLNTPFVIFKTTSSEGPPRKNYFQSEKEAEKLLCKTDTTRQNFPKTNIVVIILESFAKEYTGLDNPWKGYTPFLDSLASEGISFSNHFANGRTSQDALPAVLASIPRFSNEAYITSGFETNRMEGFAQTLTRNGYKTMFFHGGKNGTMGFDFFSKMAGFQKYYGLNEYPSPNGFDGNWGIFDEPFLQFFAQQLSKTQAPFCAGIFTLSSHQPYTIPPRYKGRFPKGTLPVHESVGYADFSLRQFFHTAKQMPWYQNTLFILTADHTQMSDKVEYQHDLGAYAVPLVFFHPQKKFPAVQSRKMVQHLDIGPSVLDYLGILPQKRSCFGESVFYPSPGKTYHYENEWYYLYHPDYMIQISSDEEKRYFSMPGYKPAQARQAPENYLKALIQYHNNGMLDNGWYK